MKANQTVTVPTPESVWAALQETDRILSEKQAETDRIVKETSLQMKETSKNIDKILGRWGNNLGSFAEEYFFNSFDKGKTNFFGENFDEIERNLKGIEKGFKDEYDIVLINGKSVGIIEVKFKARGDVVPHVLRKVETFRINFPKYKNHKVYLGLAALSFHDGIEEECCTNGIAVIKQVGDTVIIIDDELKAY